MTAKTPIAWDLETHLIKPGMCAPRMVCLSKADEKGNTALLGREQGLDEAEHLINDEFTTLHHPFFDLGVIAAERGRAMPTIFKAFDEGRIHCTKIRQMCIDNARGDLKFLWNEETNEYKKQSYQLYRLVQRHLGYDIQHKKVGPDIWRLRYNELDGVPIKDYPVAASSYAIDDSVETLQIWQSQEVNDVAPDHIIGLESQMQAGWGLYLMQMWGHRTDPPAVAKLEKSLKNEMAEQIAICHEYGFRRGGTKYRGEKAIREALDDGAKFSRDLKKIRGTVEAWYTDQDAYEMDLTPKGAIATSREQLVRTNHPGLVAVAETVRIEKQLSTYVSALWRGTEVPLNPSYNPILETFRTSCSGGMKIDKVPVGWNIQNPSRKGGVRECVIPRPGYVFAFCDYDTLEMLTLGQVCLDLFGYSHIIEAAHAGEDFHLSMAADMLEIPYSTAVSRHKAGDEDIIDARQGCKIANYGMAGGMSASTFIEYAKGFGFNGREKPLIAPALAQRLHKGFRRKWREMTDYFNHCSFLCDGGRAKQIKFVRSGMRRGRVGYCATANGFFQHLAAMGAKEAVYEVSRECYVDAGSPLYNCRPFLFAHDEIGMEVPEGLGPRGMHAAAMRLQEVMVERMKRWCPDVPIAATVAMSRRWMKGTPPVFVKGLLVPSKPIKNEKGKVLKWVADL